MRFVCFILNKNSLHAHSKQYNAFDFIGLRQNRRDVFVSIAVWSCGWLVLACYGFFQVFPLLTNDDVKKCFGLQIYYKSTSWFFVIAKWNVLRSMTTFIIKPSKWYHKVASFYDKVVQVLESRKYLLQIGAGITNWGNYYKVGGKWEKRGKVTDFDNQVLDSLLTCLV